MNTSLPDDFPLSRSELLSPLIFCLLLPCLKQLNSVIVVRGANVTITTSGFNQRPIVVINNPSNSQGNNQDSQPAQPQAPGQTSGQGNGQGAGQSPGAAPSPGSSATPPNQQAINGPVIPNQSQVSPNQRPNRTSTSRPNTRPSTASPDSQLIDGNNFGINFPSTQSFPSIPNPFQVTSSPGNQNNPKAFERSTDIDRVTGNPGTSLYFQGNSRRRLMRSKVSNRQDKRPANRRRNKATLSNESTINLQRRVKVNTRNGSPLNRRLIGSTGNNNLSCRQTICSRQRQTNRKI